MLVFCVLWSVVASAALKSLLVYGDNFLFSAREPDGWVGEIGSAAKFSANVVFHAVGPMREDGIAVVRVAIVDKSDEDISKDLDADEAGYVKQYPGIKFDRLELTHPRYKVYAKEFVLPGRFHEYVAYVNPGPTSRLMFSVALNTSKSNATAAQLSAFSKIIASLEMLQKIAVRTK